ncbi:SDR family oxidoreductase [Nocardia colli]|uniref:SDR family oxidoreductase n=1 Tax=Nocardia colli TaxID=2545717 RepID=UPI00168D68A9|nr:SDR family oxidoreductase [Nocardia colli]
MRDGDSAAEQRCLSALRAGDLTSAAVVGQLPAREITDVWHCAASLRFEDRSRYQLSKIAAEHLVAERDSMSTCIWRPSVVVGHSRTLSATNFTGRYGLVRECMRFERCAERILGARFLPKRVGACVDPTAEINLVPIDLVVQQAVSLSLRPGFAAGIVHLTNGSAPSVGDVVSVVAATAGVRELEFVTCPSSLTAIERRLDRTMGFYPAQGGGTKSFAQDVAEQYGAAIHFPMDVDYLRSLIDWYVDHAGLADKARAA